MKVFIVLALAVTVQCQLSYPDFENIDIKIPEGATGQTGDISKPADPTKPVDGSGVGTGIGTGTGTGTGITNPNQPPCGIDNWVQTPFGTCLKIFHNGKSNPLSWTAAQEACRQNGGDLFMADNPQKNHWLKSLIYNHHRGRSFWLGGKYTQSGWTWMKQEGATPMTFGEFTPGEPSMFSGKDNCVILGANLLWWDDPCSMQNPVIDTICEKKALNSGMNMGGMTGGMTGMTGNTGMNMGGMTGNTGMTGMMGGMTGGMTGNIGKY